MRRRLLNLLTALSVLLFVAAAALWVLSCWRYVEVSSPIGGRSTRLSLLPHAIWVEWTDRPFFPRGVRVDRPAYGFHRFAPFFRLRVEPPPVRDVGLGGERPPTFQQVRSERYSLFGFGYWPPWKRGQSPLPASQCRSGSRW